MTSINDRMKQFFEDLANDPIEDRVVEYIIREVHNGRSLLEVLDDPYVRNRFDDEKRNNLLENPEIIEAMEQEIRTTMTPPELGFSS